MNQYLKLLQWIIPIALILIGWFVGGMVEKAFFKRLRQFIDKNPFIGNELILKALDRMPSFWLFLAGLYGAALTLPIAPTVAGIFVKILTAIFLYTVTLIIAKIAAGLMTLYSQRIEGLSASLLSNLVKIAVTTFGILIILQFLEISITPILATLGISGLVVGLAFQDTLSNLFAGLHLIISRQVRTGDYVRLATGEEGYVTDINWRNTAIKEISNNIIIVPNNKLASAIFKNFHLPAREITIQVPVGVSYDSDLEEVERVTIEVAREVMQTVTGGVPDFEPFIRFQEFNDFHISFVVFLRVMEFLDQRLVKHEFIKKLHKRYREEGIEIPYPSQNLYLKQDLRKESFNSHS